MSSEGVESSKTELPQNSRERASVSLSPFTGMLVAMSEAGCILRGSAVGEIYCFFIVVCALKISNCGPLTFGVSHSTGGGEGGERTTTCLLFLDFLAVDEVDALWQSLEGCEWVNL